MSLGNFHWNSNIQHHLIDPIAHAVTSLAVPVTSIVAPELAPFMSAGLKVGSAIANAPTKGAGMADIHYHLEKTNTYDRRPNNLKYNERPSNHNAHKLMLKHHFDYEKRGGGFGQVIGSLI